MNGMISMGAIIFLNVLLVAIVVWAVIGIGREQKRDGMRKRNEAPKNFDPPLT